MKEACRNDRNTELNDIGDNRAHLQVHKYTRRPVLKKDRPHRNQCIYKRHIMPEIQNEYVGGTADT